jgi:outer membrane protein W
VLCSAAALPSAVLFLPMTRHTDLASCRRAAAASLAALALAAPALAQQAEPSWTQRALAATNDSTPVGLLPRGERSPGFGGWFADAWEGSKRIFRDGRSDLLLPMFAWHPAYKYPNRHDQNSYPWGAGVARTLFDDKDNERLVYALAFSDSHYDFQPMVGYGWIARWPLGAGLKGGLGYTVFVTARSDANYIPFPAILPLASIGTDRFTLYGSWIPSTDVIFLFSRIALPFGEPGPGPDPRGTSSPAGGARSAAQGRAGANLLYAAAAWVDTNASGIDTVASGNSSAPLLGYRRFLSERLALDLSVARSNISLDLNGARLGTFDMTPVTVAAQYHFPAYRGLRMYAGLGVAYTRMSSIEMPGYTLSGTTIGPVAQAGFSYALADSLVLTGGLTAGFPRNQLGQDGTNLGTVQLSPATFSLGLGFAF